jgi:hypothetical protein
VVRDVDKDEFVRKDSAKVVKWEADFLEKGRKVAAQE